MLYADPPISQSEILFYTSRLFKAEKLSTKIIDLIAWHILIDFILNPEAKTLF